MSKIRIELPDREEPCTGKSVSFIAPCDCTVTECIQIEGQDYAVVDAIGRTVTGSLGAWATGAIVTVILNCEERRAYIQNCAKPALAIEDISNLADTITMIGEYYNYLYEDILGAYAEAKQEATQEKPGRMTASDKKKLDSIEQGATKTTIDDVLSNSSTNPVQNKVVTEEINKCVPLTGGTMIGALNTSGVILKKGVDYGESFPTSGNVEGKFFLILREENMI